MKKDKQLLKQQTNTKHFFALLISAASIVVFICTLFVFQIRQTTAAETERYLSELSSSVVYSVDARLQANLDALDSIAITYVEEKRSGRTDMTYLRKKAEVHKFVNLFIMSLDGKAVDSDGNVYDFSRIPQIMDTLNGNKTIMNDAVIFGETKNGFAYSVPIYEDDVITGALIAGNSTEWIKNLLSQTYFNGEGFFHIIDADGNFIVKSNNPYSMTENRNFFYGLEAGAHFNYDSSLVDLKELVADNQSGTVYFSMEEGKVPKIGKVIPLNCPGYYLFLVVLEKAASHQFDTLLFNAVFNNGMIALLFVALVILLFFINYRNNKHLSMLAFVDPVTKGYSQIRFEKEAWELIQGAGPGAFTFVSLNVTNFKLINDTFGTHDGDRILKHIHDVTVSFLGEQELICRSFSDNFDLLLKTRSQDKILEKLKDITEKINAFNIHSNKKYYLILTVGIYQIDDPGLSIVHIRDRANVARKSSISAYDTDLFTCVFYSDPERQKQRRYKDIENKMNDALENHDFVVFFQPKVRLKDQKIVGAEALVRWLDREWGMIPPNDFIPFFEQNHFIVQLDLYVFEQVCISLRSWLDAGIEPVKISVNLSRVHLNKENFLQRFLHIQQKYHIPPELLEMELTETVLFNNQELVTHVIDQIHQNGFSCSIDDFGSGYSSLNLLKNINADTLKLDKAFFCSPLADDFRERVIIEAVVDMAQRLKINTVAEGVETTEQMEFMKEIKCDMVQGFVISKPVEISCFEEMAYHRKISGQSE